MRTPISSVLIIALCCLTVMFSGACAGRKATPDRSLQSFHEYRLNNGIPVVIRQNPISRVHSVVLSISGGNSVIAPEKAGLDSSALQLLCMASQRYPDHVRRDILKRTSSSISASTDLDFSTIQLQTIDIYFAETFDLFLDLIMQPAFPKDLFQEVRTNALNAYHADITDGYKRASRVVNRAFFDDHPYQSHLQTPATLHSIALQDVRDFYKQNFTASRLAVFAVGNFNKEALITRLNTTIGSLPKGTAAPAAPARFAHTAQTHLLLDENPNLSPDASYLRGNFSTVPPDHRDYWPLFLASRLLTDIMNDILRTRHGLVYSTWSIIYNKKTNYGNVSVYRTNDPLRAIELITDAIKIAADGKCVSPYSQQDIPGTYIDIDKALGFYKTSFSTEYFSGLQDNASVALRMAAAHNTLDDCRQYLFSMDRINSVSARDIIRVVNHYMHNRPVTWALSAHPDTIATIEKQCNAAVSACERIQLH